MWSRWMPWRSGSLTSRLKECVSRCSSKRRDIIVQSSKPKLENSGSVAPTSRMFSTPKTSSLSKSTLSSSSSDSASSSSSSSTSILSSSLASSPASLAFSLAAATAFALASLAATVAAFLASFVALSAAFLATAVLKAFCLACQACRHFCHSFHLPWNHSPGARSSMRVVVFFSWIHVLRYSLDFGSAAHSLRTSSKPSSFSGQVNFMKAVFRA
mmetsp:Transcript_97390/g.251980  ORF Transcript_97390/g.251980 Transcript_97390/m.251980 type:complete len:214 (+) Transcript_97390:663-1304(+)